MATIFRIEDPDSVGESGTNEIPELCRYARLLLEDVTLHVGDPELWKKFSREDIEGTTLRMLANWRHHHNRCTVCRAWYKQQREREEQRKQRQRRRPAKMAQRKTKKVAGK